MLLRPFSGQPAHGCGGIELLGDRDKRHIVLVEELHELGKVSKGAGQAIDLVDHESRRFFPPQMLAASRPTAAAIDYPLAARRISWRKKQGRKKQLEELVIREASASGKCDDLKIVTVIGPVERGHSNWDIVISSNNLHTWGVGTQSTMAD